MATKRVTSLDVAKRAEVSRTTVSLVLNNVQSIQISEETRQRVIEAAHDLGYVPNAAAQALAKRQAQIIGLILTRSPHHITSDAFLTQILDGLIGFFQQHGLHLLIEIVEPHHQKEAYLQLVRAKHIDGVLLSGPRFDDEGLRALEENNFPTVLIGQMSGSSLCSVDVDNCAAAKLAVDHLLQLGHKRIAFVANAPLDFTAASERLRGYRECLESAGLPFDDRLVLYGDFDPQSGYIQMGNLLAVRPLPSAVFVASDVVAIGAMLAIREHGLRIPQDIALVGFDNVPFSRYVDPPLTTVHLPAHELARRSGEMLYQLIRQEPVPLRQILLDTHLVVRQSTGTCRSE